MFLISDGIKRVQKWYYGRTFDNHRLGSFWCSKHWKVIKDSQKDKKPINPAIAAVGITSALYLRGVDPEMVRKQGAACCILFNMAEATPKLSGKKMIDGIFERSRGW